MMIRPRDRSRGSLNSFSLLLCMSFLSLLTLYSIKRYQQWLSLKKSLDHIICVKSFHQETKNLITFVHRVNQIIIAKNIIQLAGLLFPQTWVSQPTIARVKKLLQLSQNARVALYYKEILTRFRNGCRLSLKSLLTPFKLKGLSLQRDYRGVTLLRDKNLKLCHILNFQLICSEMSLGSSLETSPEIESSMLYFPRTL